MTAARLRSNRVPAATALAAMALAVLVPAAAGQSMPGRFQHEAHTSVACGDCHANGRATAATNGSWCATCHHVDVAFTQCERCHDTDDLLPEPARTLVTFDLSVGEPRTRSLVFDHGPHLELGCGDCHSGGSTLTVERECASCHVEHHRAGSRCTACHAEPVVTAHPEEVHLDLDGCGTAGCHRSEGLDYAAMADERNLCLSCHPAEIDHEVGQPCAECHILDDPADPRRPRP